MATYLCVKCPGMCHDRGALLLFSAMNRVYLWWPIGRVIGQSQTTITYIDK